MMNDSIEEQARILYELDCNQVKPTWDQLGNGTKSVWIEAVYKGTTERFTMKRHDAVIREATLEVIRDSELS